MTLEDNKDTWAGPMAGKQQGSTQFYQQLLLPPSKF